MTTTLEIIDKAHQYSNTLSDLLDHASVDENGLLELDINSLEQIEVLQAQNKEDAIHKLEGIMFAIQRKQADIELYQQTINDYRTKKKQTENQIEYLQSLALQLVELYGTENKLPTPTFPKLKARTFGKGRIIFNDDYNAPLNPAWLKPHQPSVKDIDNELMRELYEQGEVPLDTDGNPLFSISEPVLKVVVR